MNQSNRGDSERKKSNLTELIPEALSRIWPALEPDTQVLLAFLLLASHQIDALPLVRQTNGTIKFVSGYSCLRKLNQTDEKEYGNLFKKSCEYVSHELPVVSAEGDLGSLLNAFAESRFGFAWAELKANPQIGGFVTLRDILALYERSTIDTCCSLAEVASTNIFSLEGSASLKQAIDEMISRRVRRIQISETGIVVSDRQVIDHVFSPSRLKQVYDIPSSLVDGQIRDIDGTMPEKRGNDLRVKEAAEILRRSGCLICDDGLVTPWDAIMKPYERDELHITD